MSNSKSELLEMFYTAFDYKFIPSEMLDSEFKKLEDFYTNSLNEYSTLLAQKSPEVTEFIVNVEQTRYILDRIKNDLLGYKPWHGDYFNAVNWLNEYLPDEEYANTEIGKKVQIAINDYKQLIESNCEEIGEWKNLPFSDFFKVKIKEKLESKESSIIFEITYQFFDKIFNKSFNSIHHFDKYQIKEIFNQYWISSLFDNTWEALINENIKPSDSLFFNFNYANNYYKLFTKRKDQDLGVYNQFGQKIDSYVYLHDCVKILVIRNSKIVQLEITSKDINSTTNTIHQIKKLETKNNLLNIHFHGFHNPFGIYLVSSKEAVELRNKLQ
jgi:hypothetical protein